MRRIALHGRFVSPDSKEEILHLLDFLLEKGAEVLVTDIFAATNQQLVSGRKFSSLSKGDQSEVDAFISLGGDGTFLETLTYVGDSGIPIMGINTGRLGFLASTAKAQIEGAISKLMKDEFSIDTRSLVSLESSLDLFGTENYALNEFSILRRDTSSMIVINCYLNDVFLNTYWADGLMVSTPTGSTGYSLSCGGPILLPENENFVITPVSPHNLNIRPLIVPDNTELKFTVESRNTSFLISLDSRSHSVEEGIDLKVRKAPFMANLIKIEGNSFVETLRTKLSWGLDKRN